MTKRTLLFCLFLLTPLTQAYAETVYVTDKLKLTLHALPDGSSEKITVLESGDKLTILEQIKFYAKVKTEEGQIGWTKAAYLVTEVPPRHRLTKLEAQNESLTAKLAATKKDLDLTQQMLQEASQNIQNAEELRNQNAALLEEQQRYKHSVPLTWFLSVTAIALVLGFVAGIWLFDYRSRKRHGGYRVY